MIKGEQVVRVYEDLAYQYDRQGQAKLRDCFLMLAADAAFETGWEDEAERLRIQLLSFNPNHLLRPYPSFADALRSPDIQSYIEDLRFSHPPEEAERQLLRRPSGETSLSKGGMNSGSPAAEDLPTTSNSNGRNEEPPVYKLKNPQEESRPTRPADVPARPVSSPRPGIVVTPSARNSPLPSSAAKSAAPIRGMKSRLPFPGATGEPARILSPAEETGTAGRWFSTLLFALLLTAGLALGFYTLVGPFLPRDWLPG